MNERGDIAQLIRAPALQAGGPGFESLYLHHSHGVVWAYVHPTPPIFLLVGVGAISSAG